MRQVFSPYRGRWWKFGDYELVNGRIAPVAGSELTEYDPWEGYLRARAQGKERVPPYQRLLALTEDLDAELLMSLDFTSASDMELDEELEERVLRWCRHYGLLGLLPQLYQRIRLPLAVRITGAPAGEGSGTVAQLEWTRYMWTPDGWEELPLHMRLEGEDAREFAEELSKEGALHRAGGSDHGAERASRAEGVLVGEAPVERLETYGEKLIFDKDELRAERSRPWLTGQPVFGADSFVSSKNLLPMYFPGLRDADGAGPQMPRPLTEQFWRHYQEPVGLFLLWAVWLKMALESLQGGDTPVWRLLIREEPQPLYGKSILDWLTWSTRPILGVGDERLEQHWVTASLFGSLAMMVYLDLVEGGRVKVCANCGTTFATRVPRAKHCSERCRNTAQKRRQRERKRKRDSASGCPPAGKE